MAVASIRGGSTQHKRLDSSTATPPTLHANDVFAGARIALNDIQDTSRLGEHWKLEAETRWCIGINRDNLLNSVRDDSYLTIRLRRFL
jgi:hypothetical protein